MKDKPDYNANKIYNNRHNDPQNATAVINQTENLTM